ncbi:Nucleoside-diphosphate-sugar epimerase [Modicisalibacter ilicicola DSM 19980]|uniref:Nucleoside-diphosphate-sugar epimerase n=1 Tax=Modicisalibacter ilicicola DSM 19980 TaxID=1121942 RepID=A0A1M4VZS0_9GAMM|nr:SDR family oxidoreductase [Halomonas ilicicola]SHE74478.1 Nucleoside-diphosphate-sugar epimerase [Halomonas ilicicola DSM 19980]
MKNTCLILGCGDIGKTLGLQLIEAGHRVIGARRNPDILVGSGIEPLAVDLNDPASLEALPDADIVIYVVSADRFDEQAYQAAYRDGLRAMLAELDRRPRSPRRVFFVSSTSVYAQQGGETVDETSETQPTGFAGQLMREAELTLIEHRLPGTVVRFSGIYGPGRDRLIQQVREGRIAASTPPMYSNRIHRDDCAGVLTHMIAKALNDEPLEELYLASDCEPVPLHEVMAWLAKRLKVETHEVIQSPLRRRSSKRCDNSRLLETGYRFRYPTFREGYAQVLDCAAPATSEKA